MADVLNRTTGLTAPYWKDYRTSVNEINFDTADWIISPDLSAVTGQPTKYWDVSGDSVTLVDGATQASRDAEIAVIDETNRKEGEKDRYDVEDMLRSIVKLTVDELNILRAEHAFPDRTYEQAKTKILADIDGGV